MVLWTVRPEAVRVQAVRVEAVRLEAMRLEAVRAQAVRVDAVRLASRRLMRFTRLAESEPSDLPSPHPAVRPVSCHVCVAGAAKGEAATTEEATATDSRKERELESDEAALSRL